MEGGFRTEPYRVLMQHSTAAPQYEIYFFVTKNSNKNVVFPCEHLAYIGVCVFVVIGESVCVTYKHK